MAAGVAERIKTPGRADRAAVGAQRHALAHERLVGVGGRESVTRTLDPRALQMEQSMGAPAEVGRARGDHPTKADELLYGASRSTVQPSFSRR